MSMARLNDITAHCNALLQINEFSDYCPNGLQVEGREDVRLIVSGVSASQALIERAVDEKADALLVHHGYFWKGEDPTLRGMKYRRIKMLVEAGISLMAYHLPLDAHPTLGNNVQLGKKLGFESIVRIEAGRAKNLLFTAELANPLSPLDLSVRLSTILRREPLHIEGGPRLISKVAWCTGGAQSYIEDAAVLGVDAYISGEVSEQTTHFARENGLHFFAAGHHATERFGVQAVGDELANIFSIKHRFVEIPNPV